MGEDKLKDKIMEEVHKGSTYKEIQLRLGSPSKKYIRKVIKERNPELYSIIKDTKKLQEYRDNKFEESCND